MDEEFDKCSAWFVCICCSLASLINLGSSYIYGLFFPFILNEFKAGKAATAFIGSFTIAFLTGLGPVSSKLCQRFGSRLVMVCGGLASAAAVLGSSFSPSIYVLFLTYSIGFGFSSSLVYFAALQIVPLYFDRFRSLALAVVSSGPGAGLLLMSPLVQNLLKHFNWRISLMILAAVNLLPCILGCSIKRKMVSRILSKEDSRQNTTSTICLTCCKSMDVSVLKNPNFMIACFSMAVCCLGYMMPSIHLAKYAQDLGIPISLSSWMYFNFGIASLVFRILTGRLCDTGWFSPIHIYQFGAVIFGIADFLLPFMQNFQHLMMYSVAYGVCEGVFATAMNCHMLRSFPGMGFGWYMGIIGSSFMIGPVLAGLIADLSGSYHPAFITAGALFFTAACLPFLTKLIRKSADKPEEIKLNDLKDGGLVIFQKITVL